MWEILSWQLHIVGFSGGWQSAGADSVINMQMRKRREFLKLKREEAKSEEGVQVAIPAPDPPLPPSFDADVNAHRYRFLEQPGGWLAR